MIVYSSTRQFRSPFHVVIRPPSDSTRHAVVATYRGLRKAGLSARMARWLVFDLLAAHGTIPHDPDGLL